LDIPLLSIYNHYDEDDLIKLNQTQILIEGLRPSTGFREITSDFSKILEAINDKGIRDLLCFEYNIIYETFQKWNNKYS